MLRMNEEDLREIEANWTAYPESGVVNPKVAALLADHRELRAVLAEAVELLLEEHGPVRDDTDCATCKFLAQFETSEEAQI